MAANASPPRRTLLAGGFAAFLLLPILAGAEPAATSLLRRFTVAPLTIPRTAQATAIPLNIAPIRDRLASVAASRRSTLLLRLGGVHVARPPGVVWRVYLAPPGTTSRGRAGYFVGSVALFSRGVGEGAPATTVELGIDEAVLRSLPRTRGVLELGFVPTGPLVDGRPTSPRPTAALRIDRVSMWVRDL